MPQPVSETALKPTPSSQRTGKRRRTFPPITREARAELCRKAVQLYNPAPGTGRPLSIRQIATQLDRSYGFVWTLLTEAGAVLRPANRHKANVDRRDT